MSEDTIAAISTPGGSGGIAIVRMSGPDAVVIAAELFQGSGCLQEAATRTIHYGWIEDPETGSRLDEVLISIIRGPGSYTREDVVEINCHGGNFVARKVLQVLLAQGVRLAEPGEFTRRAFMNGRIDLSQAEAVCDIINAKTRDALSLAERQLSGELGKKLDLLYGELLDIISQVEVEMDFPDEDLAESDSGELIEQVEVLREKILRLAQGFEEGRILRDGIRVLIAGKPNVGKSSLLNRLLEEERAIVSHLPGTTRDMIEEQIVVDGILIRLVDTAGIRNADDYVENIGVQRALDMIGKADLILHLLDPVQGLTDEDREILELCRDKKRLLVVNKSDTGATIDLPPQLLAEAEGTISISAETGAGIEDMLKRMTGMFMSGEVEESGDDFRIATARHHDLLTRSAQSLSDAVQALKKELPAVFVAADLGNALSSIGEITGKETTEELIDNIFSKFCLGK